MPRAAVLLLTLHCPKEEDDIQQNTVRPLGWGRSTNKNELLHKPQIIPSQLMCKDGAGRGRKAAAGISENNVGRKKKEGGRRARLSRPRLSAPFGGGQQDSDQPDLKPDKLFPHANKTPSAEFAGLGGPRAASKAKQQSGEAHPGRSWRVEGSAAIASDLSFPSSPSSSPAAAHPSQHRSVCVKGTQRTGQRRRH